MKNFQKKQSNYIKRYLEPPYGREIEGTVELLKEVKDALSEQSKADKWIPCSDELPILDLDVEVTTKDNERFIAHYAGGCWTGRCIQVKAWKEPSEPWEGEIV